MELPGGSVLANIRPDSGAVSPRGARVTAASTDGGETFSAPRPDPALINGHCQASMLRAKEDASCPRCGDRVLFANPATAAGRCNGAAKPQIGVTKRHREAAGVQSSVYEALPVPKLISWRICQELGEDG